jgi:hypothetical protein
VDDAVRTDLVDRAPEASAVGHVAEAALGRGRRGSHRGLGESLIEQDQSLARRDQQAGQPRPEKAAPAGDHRGHEFALGLGPVSE